MFETAGAHLDPPISAESCEPEPDWGSELDWVDTDEEALLLSRASLEFAYGEPSPRASATGRSRPGRPRATHGPDDRAMEVSTPGDLLAQATVTAGSPLAQAMAEIPLAELDLGDLVDAVAGWSRVVAWAQSQAGEAAALLSEKFHHTRGPLVDASLDRMPRGSDPARLAATELSMRLGMTRQAAESMIRTGTLLHGPLQATAEALECGQIDHRKAEIIARALDGAPLTVALEVEDAVLPRAPRRTHPQLTQDLAKALLESSPAEATARQHRARAARRVNHPRALPDGMASILAVLPAEDAVALDLALHSAARTAKAAGDRRTMDQLRADVLAAAGIDALRTGTFGGTPPPTPTESSSGTGAAGADGTETSTPGRGPSPGFPTGSVGGAPARLHVTVPLSTLLGGSSPGELAGYGPVSPAAARALALGGTWRRIVTDPLSGTVLDVGKKLYRPPPDLARLVRERDRTCVRPGCGTRAQACDLDHTVPFGVGPDGGPTALGNLGAACPLDHQLKTRGDFRVRQLPGGLFEWTSRSGHTYRREADGSISHLGRTSSYRDPWADGSPDPWEPQPGAEPSPGDVGPAPS